MSIRWNAARARQKCDKPASDVMAIVGEDYYTISTNSWAPSTNGKPVVAPSAGMSLTFIMHGRSRLIVERQTEQFPIS
jgi:hypothetical protein